MSAHPFGICFSGGKSVSPAEAPIRMDLFEKLEEDHKENDSTAGQLGFKCIHRLAAEFDATTEAAFVTTARKAKLLLGFPEKSRLKRLGTVLLLSIGLNTLQGLARIAYNVIEVVARLTLVNVKILFSGSNKGSRFKANLYESSRCLHLIVKGALQAVPVLGHFVARIYTAGTDDSTDMVCSLFPIATGASYLES